MAVFKVDIEKVLGGEYWTNVYYVDVADLASAEAPALEIVACERAVTGDEVTFTKMRISDTIPDTDIYHTILLAEPGLRAVDTANLLALFNVVRVDFSANVGRPSRKYLRGILTEGDVAFNDIAPAFVTFMDDNYSAPMLLIDELCDVDGDTFEASLTYPYVAMRQLRRGNKRRTAPIIP